MLIEILKVSEVRKDGKYQKMDVSYIREGKSADRKLVAIGKTTEVVQILSKAKPGEQYEIEVEKSGEFWNWIGATKVEAPAAQAAARSSYQVLKSTYETPDERARKQVYIVRQSSLTNAIEFLQHQGKKFSTDEVLDVARTFVSFVFATDGAITVDEEALGGDQDPNSKFQDDIPF